MAHQKTHPQPATPSQENIIHQVAIEPQVSEVWLNAMADIARLVRLQKGTMHPIAIGEETAMAAPGGSLLLTVMVNTEKLEMAIPPGMWRWNSQRPSVPPQ